MCRYMKVSKKSLEAFWVSGWLYRSLAASHFFIFILYSLCRNPAVPTVNPGRAVGQGNFIKRCARRGSGATWYWWWSSWDWGAAPPWPAKADRRPHRCSFCYDGVGKRRAGGLGCFMRQHLLIDIVFIMIFKPVDQCQYFSMFHRDIISKLLFPEYLHCSRADYDVSREKQEGFPILEAGPAIFNRLFHIIFKCSWACQDRE